jgi:hypothetical protein
MGILSDIILADRSEAPAINAAGGQHLKRWECLESKGIDTIKLGNLFQILMSRSLDDVDAVANFMMDSVLDERSKNGPWIYLVPDELTAAVAALNDDAIESVAAKWADTEEFQLARWQPADVEEYLSDLVPFAQKATAMKKPLLLWMSL